MLQIRLNKGASSETTGGTKSASSESITVACPDHLVLSDLPVAKCLGSVNPTSTVKIVGRRSRRPLGERVHFCVRCDYPISVYGRLSPCEHSFCLDCARSDSICYLCDERIQKIQTIKMMEGIYICAAPHCLKSFLKRNEFEGHIRQSHADLVLEKRDDENGVNLGRQQVIVSESIITTSAMRTPPPFHPPLQQHNPVDDMNETSPPDLHYTPQQQQQQNYGGYSHAFVADGFYVASEASTPAESVLGFPPCPSGVRSPWGSGGFGVPLHAEYGGHSVIGKGIESSSTDTLDGQTLDGKGIFAWNFPEKSGCHSNETQG